MYVKFNGVCACVVYYIERPIVVILLAMKMLMAMDDIA